MIVTVVMVVTFDMQVIASEQGVEVASERVSETVMKMVVIAFDFVVVAVVDDVAVALDAVAVTYYDIPCHGYCYEQEKGQCFEDYIHNSINRIQYTTFYLMSRISKAKFKINRFWFSESTRRKG